MHWSYVFLVLTHRYDPAGISVWCFPHQEAVRPAQPFVLPGVYNQIPAPEQTNSHQKIEVKDIVNTQMKHRWYMPILYW